MTAKTKSTVIILSTLIIGMLLGALVFGAIVRNQIAEINGLRTSEGFISFFDDIIEPEAEQKAEIDSVLDKHAKTFYTTSTGCLGKVLAIIDSMEKDLSLVLPPDQMGRLQNRLNTVRSRVTVKIETQAEQEK
ncbi:MAG: hypothetical protein AB7T22_17075 [Calditrichaceae bacterium]